MRRTVTGTFYRLQATGKLTDKADSSEIKEHSDEAVGSCVHRLDSDEDIVSSSDSEDNELEKRLDLVSQDSETNSALSACRSSAIRNDGQRLEVVENKFEEDMDGTIITENCVTQS